MLKIIIHRFIVRYMLIAPLNTSQSDMPYFFETSHEHFVSSIGRKLSEIFDYSIKDDRHISGNSEAVYESQIHKNDSAQIFSLCSSCYWYGESLWIYMFTILARCVRRDGRTSTSVVMRARATQTRLIRNCQLISDLVNGNGLCHVVRKNFRMKKRIVRIARHVWKSNAALFLLAI